MERIADRDRKFMPTDVTRISGKLKRKIHALSEEPNQDVLLTVIYDFIGIIHEKFVTEGSIVNRIYYLEVSHYL